MEYFVSLLKNNSVQVFNFTMQKMFYIPFLLLLCFINVQAQNPENEWQNLIEKAESLSTQGQYVAAIPYLEKAFQIAEKKYGKKDTHYARTLNDLGAIYSNLGNYSKAEPLLKKVAEIRKDLVGECRSCYFMSLDNLAILYTFMGKYKDAETILKEALELRKDDAINNPSDYAETLNALAFLYYNMERYGESEEIYLQALAIQKTNVNTSSYATIVNGLVGLYCALGNGKKGEILAKQYLAIVEKNEGINHPYYAYGLNNLALMYQGVEKYRKADSLCMKALGIIEKTQGINNPYYVNILNNSALNNFYMGRYAKAKELYEKALVLLDENSPYYNQCLHNYACLLMVKKDYKDAESVFKTSLNLTEKTSGKGNTAYATTLTHLAIVYAETGNYAKAKSCFVEANRIHYNCYRKTQASLSEKERSSLWAASSYSFDWFYSFTQKFSQLHPDIVSETYNNRLKTHSILLNETEAVKRAILASKDSLLIQKYTDWQAKQSTLQFWIEKGASWQQQTGVSVAELQVDINIIEKALAAKSQAFKKAIDTTLITWQQVQASLKQGEAAVEIVRFQWISTKWTDTVYYAAMILTPNTKEHPIWVLLPNGNGMEKQGYRDYTDNIVAKTPDRLAYRRYWASIDSVLGESSTIYLSLDGVYHKLNLGAIICPDEKYLMDKRNIHLLHTTADLVNPIKRNLLLPTKSADLYGNPDYQMNILETKPIRVSVIKEDGLIATNTTAKRSIEEVEKIPQFPSLPKTQREVSTIDSLLKRNGYQSEIYLGVDAQEAQIKASRSPTILHLATHGFFYPEAKKLRQENDMGLDKAAIEENPLLSSGIAFSGANYTLIHKDSIFLKNDKKTHENGLFYAQEALLLNLENTELVVLSACETGLGKVVNGEGVYGLQRAFRIAGARTLLVSLWKVDDAKTLELMVGFYNKWLSGISAYQALVATQKEMAGKGYPACDWAGFVLIGE